MAMTVETETGLIVPASAIDASKTSIHYDRDGKRRVVLTSGDRRAVDRAMKILYRAGFVMVIVCNDTGDFKRPDNRPMCGKIAKPDGVAKLGERAQQCDCTRIHLG
jgi:hypothetical protein